MKRMLKLQIADSSYCLLSYKKHLEELKKTAREGKDPHCTKCDEFGFVKGSKSIVPIVCYCVSDEKSKIEKKIEDLAESLSAILPNPLKST